jgi:hypothetical protein
MGNEKTKTLKKPFDEITPKSTKGESSRIF